MKKNIKIIITVFIISIVGFLTYSISSKLDYKKQVTERIKTLPKFTLKTLMGIPFSQVDLNTDSPKLFIYFNSECEFCQTEAQQIHKYLTQLKGVQILFVSYEERDKIKTFAKKYRLLNRINIIFLEDKKFQFEKLFDATSFPFIVLYSKENQLIREFKGFVKIENIIKYLD